MLRAREERETEREGEREREGGEVGLRLGDAKKRVG
jgi:hypothetical protein